MVSVGTLQQTSALPMHHVGDSMLNSDAIKLWRFCRHRAALLVRPWPADQRPIWQKAPSSNAHWAAQSAQRPALLTRLTYWRYLHSSCTLFLLRRNYKGPPNEQLTRMNVCLLQKDLQSEDSQLYKRSVIVELWTWLLYSTGRGQPVGTFVEWCGAKDGNIR